MDFFVDFWSSFEVIVNETKPKNEDQKSAKKAKNSKNLLSGVGSWIQL